MKNGGDYLSFINKARQGNIEHKGSTTGSIAATLGGNDDNKKMVNIPLKDIYTEKQVREVDENTVLEYASSFRGSDTKQPMQPITVWQDEEGKYLVIMGEHRYRAQKHNFENYGDEYSTIIAIVNKGEKPENAKRRRMQLQENMMHRPMSDIEIALVVREEMEAGTFNTLKGAVEWLHLDGVETGSAPTTIMSTLSQVFSLLDDPEAKDLVEAVHKGEMKPYKAKAEHAKRIKERKQAAQNVVSMEVKRAQSKIKELEEKLKKSQALVQQIENTDGVSIDDLDYEGEIADADALVEAEKIRQVEIEEAIEIEIRHAEQAATKAQAKTAENKKPATPQRFSLDFENAISLLELLDKVAQDNDLEAIGYDPETIKRKQWDSIINDRLPEIIEAFNSN